MFDRLQRSWTLAGECFALLKADRGLLLFPLLSAVSMAVIVASFALPLAPLVAVFARQRYVHTLSGLSWVALFAFYWVQFSVVIFFQTALIEVAMRRFDGQPATLRDGLTRAMARLPIILGYALIAASVGLVLRVIAERVGFMGRIVIGLLGFAWTVATALVAPVLAAEDVGPVEAVKRSAQLIRKTWGEEVIGSVGIGLAFGFVTFATGIVGAIATVFAFAGGHLVLGSALLAATVVAVFVIVLAHSTLQGIYAAALYRYASGGRPTAGIDGALLQQAFRAPRS